MREKNTEFWGSRVAVVGSGSGFQLMPLALWEVVPRATDCAGREKIESTELLTPTTLEPQNPVFFSLYHNSKQRRVTLWY